MTATKPQHDAEEAAVRDLGDRIGYGWLMQLGEQIWREVATARGHAGSEFTVGPCVAFMRPCPCPESGRDANGHCDWCCGSRRVTERVLRAIRESDTDDRPSITELQSLMTPSAPVSDLQGYHHDE